VVEDLRGVPFGFACTLRAFYSETISVRLYNPKEYTILNSDRIYLRIESASPTYFKASRIALDRQISLLYLTFLSAQ
jgi:hypothetical protein